MDGRNPISGDGDGRPRTPILICCACGKVISTAGDGNQAGALMRTDFYSHGLCLDCLQRLYPEYWKGRKLPGE